MAEIKFKIGDKVRRISNPAPGMPIGFEGTVAGIEEDRTRGDIYLKFEAPEGGWDQNYFDLVEPKAEPKPIAPEDVKVGQTIEVRRRIKIDGLEGTGEHVYVYDAESRAAPLWGATEILLIEDAPEPTADEKLLEALAEYRNGLRTPEDTVRIVRKAGWGPLDE